MQYIVFALVAFVVLAAARQAAQPRRLDSPTEPLALAEIERGAAFSTLQRLTINQQRIIDSTEAKLGVLALALLGVFIALLVEPEQHSRWHTIWTVLIGIDIVPILFGMLGFKAEEPFDMAAFVASFRSQAPDTIEATIQAMALRYDANNKRRRDKDRLLTISTWLAAAFVAFEVIRRFNIAIPPLHALAGFGAAIVKTLTWLAPSCGAWPF